MSDCTALHGLCLEGNLGTVTIVVAGVEFAAHKMILCGCSQYFRALFSKRWSNAQKTVYNIPGTSPEMMALILQYASSGTVPVTADNAASLLVAADQFNVLGIIRLCCDFLKSQLCLENCIGIWRFTGHYYCPDLREAAQEFILQHFEEVIGVSRELLELPVSELELLLGQEVLSVKEEAAFDALLKWVAHDLQARRQYGAVLLGQEGWRNGQKGFFFFK